MDENENENKIEEKPKDYEDLHDEDEKALDDGTKKGILIVTEFLKYFSVSIIIFFIMSYFGNAFIAGIGLNFIPTWLPMGKLFYKFPVLASLFHPEELPPESENFFKTETIENHNYKYYELIHMGASLTSVIKGFTGISDIFDEGNQSGIEMVKIYLVNYTKSNFFQKFILCFFGAFQIILGCLTTFFSSVAYIFNSKHGLLLNLPYEKQRIEKAFLDTDKNKSPEERNKEVIKNLKRDEMKKDTQKSSSRPPEQCIAMGFATAPANENSGNIKNIPDPENYEPRHEFQNPVLSVSKTRTGEVTMETGKNKFLVFLNFIFFIPVDKLTYGTRFFLEEKHNTVGQKVKYFFLLFFMCTIVVTLLINFGDGFYGLTSCIFMTLFIFIIFSFSIFNVNKNPWPTPCYENLLFEIKKTAEINDSINKTITFNKLASKITEVKNTINDTMKKFYKDISETAKDLKLEVVKPKTAEDLKKELEKDPSTKKKIDPKLMEKLSSSSGPSKEQLEAMKIAEEAAAIKGGPDGNPIPVRQSGGTTEKVIKVKSKYKKRIQDLKMNNELEILSK